jgi:hypothetical protein
VASKAPTLSSVTDTRCVIVNTSGPHQSSAVPHVDIHAFHSCDFLLYQGVDTDTILSVYLRSVAAFEGAIACCACLEFPPQTCTRDDS